MDIPKIPNRDDSGDRRVGPGASSRFKPIDVRSDGLKKVVSPMMEQALKVEGSAARFFAVAGVVLSYTLFIPAIVEIGLWIDKMVSQEGLTSTVVTKNGNQAFSIRGAKKRRACKSKGSGVTFKIEELSRNAETNKAVKSIMEDWYQRGCEKNRLASNDGLSGTMEGTRRFRQIVHMARYMRREIDKPPGCESAPFDKFILTKTKEKVQSVACYDSKTGEIAIIVTNPDNNKHPLNKDCRVSGAATSIIKYLVKKRDPNPIILDAVPSAVPFYSRLGFIENPDREPRLDGETAMMVTASKIKRVVVGRR